MTRRSSDYHSYLIRFWRMDNAGQPVWRAALQEPGSEMQSYFESPGGAVGISGGADRAGRR